MNVEIEEIHLRLERIKYLSDLVAGMYPNRRLSRNIEKDTDLLLTAAGALETLLERVENEKY